MFLAPRTGVPLRLLLPDAVTVFLPLELYVSIFVGDESCLRGIFIVRVIVRGATSPISGSSGAASTVTLIFHGLRLCSDTEQNVEEATVAPVARLEGFLE